MLYSSIMSGKQSKLRFNFGYLIEAPMGTSRTIELAYPKVRVADDLTLSPLNGEFSATRTGEGIYLSGELHSSMLLQCTRCLEDTQQPIKFRLDELIYYPPHEAPVGELTIGDTGMIDLAPLFRELSLLQEPIKAVCKSDCQGLCIECGQNLNESDCGCESDDIDPRFAALKQLLK